MLEPDCLEQEGHITRWRRLASGEEPTGFAIYASFGTTTTIPSRITCCLGVQWLGNPAHLLHLGAENV